jgi:hypothetical protein
MIAMACQHLGYIDGFEKKREAWVFQHGKAKAQLFRPANSSRSLVASVPVYAEAG